MTVREALTFDLSEVYAKLEGMEAKIDAAIRPAAQAGAQVFYEEAVLRAPSRSGKLKSAIYQKFLPEESSDRKATYKVSWRTGYKKGTDGTALPTAPHGHLLEFGWVQRYEVYYNSRGEFKTKIRPEAKGKKRPSRFAPQSVKDAYYVLRKGGPVQWLPKSFIRASYEAKRGEAIAAIEAKLVEEISK